MSERARSFGSVAATYERYRPGYPEALVDAVLAHARRPVRTALEMGAGTGKATRVFAARGIDVTATDPDAAMLEELRRHVPGVRTVVAALEDLEDLKNLDDLAVSTTYDLVLAAASLHWTEPTRRWSRVAALLEPDGVLASFGGQLDLADADVEEAVRAARAAYLSDDDAPTPAGPPASPPAGTAADAGTPPAMQWPGSELLDSPLFTDVRESVITRRLSMTASDYVGHLSTISAYLMLAEDTRGHVLDLVRQALPDEVEVVGDLTLHLAVRAPDGA